MRSIVPADLHPAPLSGFRRVLPALGLFFLAPLVGEFLLGNMPVTWLGALVVLAPLYGGGALLIREVSRRAGLGWPGLVVLGLTFGVIEEAFATQSLFNPNYLGLRLLDDGFIPSLGIGLWWTVFVLSLHTVWSTMVPIALMETLTPGRRRQPWLGRVGLGVSAALFILGCVAIASFEWKKGFVARPGQFAGAGVVVTGLIVVAFVAGRQSRAAPVARSAPAPWWGGLVALLSGFGFFALVWVHGRVGAGLYATGTVALWAATAWRLITWARRTGWSERHRLGVAAGFLLTYVWHGFVQHPSVGQPTAAVDLAGDVIFGLGALALLALAARRARLDPL